MQIGWNCWNVPHFAYVYEIANYWYYTRVDKGHETFCTNEESDKRNKKKKCNALNGQRCASIFIQSLCAFLEDYLLFEVSVSRCMAGLYWFLPTRARQSGIRVYRCRFSNSTGQLIFVGRAGKWRNYIVVCRN